MAKNPNNQVATDDEIKKAIEAKIKKVYDKVIESKEKTPYYQQGNILNSFKSEIKKAKVMINGKEYNLKTCGLDGAGAKKLFNALKKVNNNQEMLNKKKTSWEKFKQHVFGSGIGDAKDEYKETVNYLVTNIKQKHLQTREPPKKMAFADLVKQQQQLIDNNKQQMTKKLESEIDKNIRPGLTNFGFKPRGGPSDNRRNKGQGHGI